MAIQSHVLPQEIDPNSDPKTDKKTAKPEDAVTDKSGQSKPTPEKEPDPELDISDDDSAP